MKWECKKVTYTFEDGTEVAAEDWVRTDERDKEIIKLFYGALGYDVVFPEG